MQSVSRWTSVFIAAGLAANALCADPLELQIRPVWDQLLVGQSRSPLLVTVRNRATQDAIGKLVVSGGQDSVVIPVEVARQSDKTVPVFPFESMGDLKLTYESQVGGVKVEIPTMFGTSAPIVGLIGGQSGDLAFLNVRRQKSGALIAENSVGIGYATVEDAPERPIGISLLEAVFLGEGCERLNDRQVEALKQYVVQGGRLVIPGGTNVPVLSSKAWANVLPLTEAGPKTYQRGATIWLSGRRGKVQVVDPITLMLGKPAVASYAAAWVNGDVLSVVRPLGLGSIIFLGYDPFDEPILSHPNRKQLVLDALKKARYGDRSPKMVEIALGVDRPYDEYSYSGRSSVSSRDRNGPRQAEALYAHHLGLSSSAALGSPFNVELLPSATVAWIFFGFFVMVVPVNFIILRMLRRMELAWVTTPIISAVFAGILLGASSGLYSAKMSKTFSGLIVQDFDSGLNAQWLRANFYMPRGGSYDFTLPNTDQVVSGSFVKPRDDPYGYSRREQETFELTSVDTGVSTVPRIDVSNLAFRELSYRRIDTPPLRVELDIRQKGSAVVGRVTNRSPYTLLRVALVVQDRTYVLPDLQKGQSTSIASAAKMQSAPSYIGERSTGQAFLYAFVKDFDPGGPGQLINGSTKVLLVCCKEISSPR